MERNTEISGKIVKTKIIEGNGNKILALICT